MLALGVEGAHGHRDARGAEKVAVLIEQRRGDTAEVWGDLLAVGRDAGAADAAEIGAERVRIGDRVRREALEAGGQVALERLGGGAGQYDLHPHLAVMLHGCYCCFW